MTEADSREWRAFVAVYRARDELEAAIKAAMDVLWDAEDDQWEAPYEAAEAIFEDFQLRENLQTVIDALEELSDDRGGGAADREG